MTQLERQQQIVNVKENNFCYYYFDRLPLTGNQVHVNLGNSVNLYVLVINPSANEGIDYTFVSIVIIIRLSRFSSTLFDFTPAGLFFLAYHQMIRDTKQFSLRD